MIVWALESQRATPQEGIKPTPAQGYTIHVMTPHKYEEGTVPALYHHYWKPVSTEVIQCLLFESTDPHALLTDIEYSVAKFITRAHVPLDTWNKYDHDHEVEIATGRVQVRDMPQAQAKIIAAVAAKPMASSSIFGPMGPKRPTDRGTSACRRAYA